MKKICILFLSLFIIVLTGVGILSQPEPSSQPQASEYLRIHIRANSSSQEDQAVKYLVRDKIVEYLTPLVANCESKRSAMEMAKEHLSDVAAVAQNTLRSNGFFYGAAANVKTEYFPTRVYEDHTLQAGEYDALIVELGEGVGDNWWCCIYPPFCFTKGEGDVVYRSAIWETIQKFYS